jgi:hypothetical protein
MQSCIGESVHLQRFSLPDMKDGRIDMRSFIAASIAAIVIAAIGAIALDLFQKPVSVAFTTESARL